MPTLTTAQAAERLGVSDRRVRQYIATGALKAGRAGRDWLINERDLMRFAPLPAGRPRKRK
jgi:excisionase family DNA binding protein